MRQPIKQLALILQNCNFMKDQKRQKIKGKKKKKKKAKETAKYNSGSVAGS